MNLAENTPENKKAFIRMHAGQNILMHHNSSVPSFVEMFSLKHDYWKDGFIALKHPDNLTDDELHYLAGNDLGDNKDRQNLIDHAKGWIKLRHMINLNHRYYDIMRALGYGVDWRGIPIETLIEWGWCRWVEKL